VPTIAILPVKSFSTAKQRLRDGLDPAQREDLALAMFSDVLSSLGLVPEVQIIVVTASAAARALALEQDARVVQDRETGHNAAAVLGIEEAINRGADRVLLVPGDCPALAPAEVRTLLSRPLPPRSVTIVPDRHGAGTNALLIRPPDALAPAFGPGSCRRHLDLARSAGLHAEIVEVPSLALDIDTAEDLDALGNLPRGPATDRFLSQLAQC